MRIPMRSGSESSGRQEKIDIVGLISLFRRCRHHVNGDVNGPCSRADESRINFTVASSIASRRIRDRIPFVNTPLAAPSSAIDRLTPPVKIWIHHRATEHGRRRRSPRSSRSAINWRKNKLPRQRGAGRMRNVGCWRMMIT